jgi:hypothetical protein
MSLNSHLRHTDADKPVFCFLCGKKISRGLELDGQEPDHGIRFQGTDSKDENKYVEIFFHILCLLEFTIINFKESRFSLHSEYSKLSTVPRTADINHVKIKNWEDRR